MPTKKMIRCDCGFIARGATEEELFQVIHKHAKEVHGVDMTREQALAMAELEP
jgi:predicted small metal-binding protein